MLLPATEGGLVVWAQQGLHQKWKHQLRLVDRGSGVMT